MLAMTSGLEIAAPPASGAGDDGDLKFPRRA